MSAVRSRPALSSSTARRRSRAVLVAEALYLLLLQHAGSTAASQPPPRARRQGGGPREGAGPAAPRARAYRRWRLPAAGCVVQPPRRAIRREASARHASPSRSRCSGRRLRRHVRVRAATCCRPLAAALFCGTAAAAPRAAGSCASAVRGSSAAQFPDAIDIIVRSLRAGHPVPVAIAMVAREMPDPVGTEFGMVADEITYGADLETALRNMCSGSARRTCRCSSPRSRSRHDRRQSERDPRQPLEGDPRALQDAAQDQGLAAEGRASAMILNAVPFVVLRPDQLDHARLLRRGLARSR